MKIITVLLTKVRHAGAGRYPVSHGKIWIPDPHNAVRYDNILFWFSCLPSFCLSLCFLSVWLL